MLNLQNFSLDVLLVSFNSNLYIQSCLEQGIAEKFLTSVIETSFIKTNGKSK